MRPLCEINPQFIFLQSERDLERLEKSQLEIKETFGNVLDQVHTKKATKILQSFYDFTNSQQDYHQV